MARRFVMSVTVLALVFSAWFVPAGKAGRSPAQQAGLQVLSSGEDGLEIELSVLAYELSPSAQVAGYQQLSIPGARFTTTAGAPQLPVYSALIGVPVGARLEIQVLEDEVQPLPGQYQLVPAPRPGRQQEDFQSPAPVFEADPVVYNQPGWLPVSPAEISSGDAWVRDQRVARIDLYPFQYDPVLGSLAWHSRMRVAVRFAGGVKQAVSGAEPDAENPFEAGLSSILLNYQEARYWRGQPVDSLRPGMPDQPLASLGPRYKIVVDHDGLYHLTYEALQSAGMPVDSIDPAKFAMSSLGQPVAIYVSNADGDANHFSPGEYIAFYGQKYNGIIHAQRYNGGNQNWMTYQRQFPDGSTQDWTPEFNATMLQKYTDDNVYWLAVGGTPGLRMIELDATPQDTDPVPDYYYATRRVEQSHEWWAYHFTGEDTWFWEYATTNAINPVAVTRTYTTSLSAVFTGPVTASVHTEVVARNFSDSGSPDHHTRFFFNDLSTPLDDAYWDGQSRYILQKTIPASNLLEGVNRLYFNEKIVTPTMTSDRIAFDFFELSYPRQFQVENDSLDFSYSESATARQYQVGGLVTSSVEVYDITNVFSPARLVNTRLTPQGGGTNRVDFVGVDAPKHGGTGRYMVVGAGTVLSPKSIRYIEPPDLFSAANGADYIIITHQDFITATRALAGYRAAQGLRVQIVDLEDLYNEFNDGVFNPIAIKNFLTYAYQNWQKPAPAYVLLVGSGHWNFKGFTGNSQVYWSKPIYMPPQLSFVDPVQGEVDSANLLVTISGDDPLPDMAVGRLPVDTPDQVDAYVQKLVAYEHSAPQEWQNRLTFVADNIPDPDGAGDFVSLSDGVINQSVPPERQVQRIYLNDYGCAPSFQTGSCPQVNFAITSTMNNTGTLFLNYIGHGAAPRWAHEAVLWTTGDPTKSSDPKYNNLLTLDNGGHLPVVLSMTCLDGYWIHTQPANISIIVEMLRAAGKGIVGSFSPTGLGVATGHDVLNKNFYHAVFEAGAQELQAATLASKLALYKTGGDFDLLHTFTIFGDPALRMLSTLAPARLENSAKAGESAEYVLQVTNVSATTDTLTMTTAAPSPWPVGFNPPSFTLPAGGHQAVTVTVTVPEGQPAGTITVTNAAAWSQKNQAPVGVSTLLTTVDNGYRVRLGPGEQSQISKPGAEVIYTLTVTNAGSLVDQYTIDVKAKWVVEAITSTSSLEPNASQVFTVTVKIPPQAVGWQQDLAQVEVVSNNDGLQKATSNLVTTASPVYQLSMAPLVSSFSAKPGGVVNYSLQVTNTGNITDTFKVGVGGAAWTVQAPVSVGPLESGVGQGFTVTVQVAGDALFGQKDVAVVTVSSPEDPAQRASAQLTTNALAVYGVSLGALQNSLGGPPGQVLTYTLQVTNTGNISDTFTVSKTGTAWPVQVPSSMGPVEARLSQGFTVPVTIPAGTVPGTQDVVTITLVSRGDNGRTATIRLTSKALAVSSKLYLPLVKR